MFPELCAELRERYGVDPEYEASGALHVAESEPRAQQLKAKARHFGAESLEWLGPEALRGIIITLPLGITLPPGIEITIDEQPVGRAPFFQCTQNGCQSRAPLTDDLLTKMKSGQSGAVSFVDAGGRVVPIPFSLQGYTAGFAAIR